MKGDGTMTPKWRIALVLVLSVAFLLSLAIAALAEKEEKVTLDQCPAAVQKAIQAQGGTVNEIEKETENGKVIYEAEITKDGKTYDVEIAENGTVIATEIDEEDGDDADQAGDIEDDDAADDDSDEAADDDDAGGDDD